MAINRQHLQLSLYIKVFFIFLMLTFFQAAFALSPSTVNPSKSASIKIMAVVSAVADAFTGTTASTTLGNVLDNDTVDGAPATPDAVNLIQISGAPAITIAADGTTSLNPGMNAGIYNAEYMICAKASPIDCSIASVQANISNVAIIAAEDAFTVSYNASAQTLGNVLTNDTLNGMPATSSNVILAQTGAATPVSIATDGTATLAANAQEGIYTTTYQICETAHPSNCDAALVTATVNAFSGISLVKTADAAGVKYAGDVITYTFTMNNPNGNLLTDVTLTDPMPGLSAISIGWPGISGQLAPGDSAVGTAAYVITQTDVDNGSIVNTATVSANSATGPVSATSTRTVPLISAAAVTITKTGALTGSGNVGDTITYEFVVANTGNVTLNGTTISDPLITSSITYAWPGAVGILSPGQSVLATANYVITQADVDSGSVTNTATVTANPPTGVAVSASDTATVVLSNAPAISLIKSAALSGNTVGSTITYTFTVQNTGNTTLNGVSISDVLPGISTIIYDTWPSGTAGILGAGQTVTATATYVITAADISVGQVSNNATVLGTPAVGAAVTASASTNTPLTAMADLSIVLTAPVTQPPGNPLNYSVAVVNAGPSAASNVVVTNTLPAGLSYVSATGPGWACNAAGQYVTCNISSLAAGATSTISLATTISASATGTITNTAQVTSDVFDPNLSNNTSSATTNLVSNQASLTIIKKTLGRDGSFAFSSTIPAAASFTIATTNGQGSKNITNLSPGTYTLNEVNLPVGWSLTSVQCNSQDMSLSAIQVQITAGQAMTCVFTNTFDEEGIRNKTLEGIATFLNHRAHLLLSANPDRKRLFDILERRVATKKHEVRPQISAAKASMHFSTSLNQLEQGRNTPRPFDIWTEAHFTYFDQPRANSALRYEGQFGLVYLGADYLLNSNFIVGVLSQFDTINERTSQQTYANSTLRALGKGWMSGPYLSAKLLPNLFLYSRAAWGTSSNKLNPLIQYNDKFDTTRQLYNAELVGNFYLKKMQINPGLSVSYYGETQQQFYNLLNIRIPGQLVELGQAALGPEFTYPLTYNYTQAILLRLMVQGIYDFKQSGFYPSNALFSKVYGRVNAGAEILPTSTLAILPAVTWDGVGNSQYQSIGGSLQIRKALD